MSDVHSKRDLRVAIAKTLAGLPADARRAMDESIQGRLRDLPEFRRAIQILAYLPLDDEPTVVPLLEEAVAAGKRVYVPVVNEGLTLDYIRWLPRDGGRASAYGRWTPSSSDVPTAGVSVILVPGRAFDREGYRLGRGKGCYDRSLAMARLGATIGIAYATQLLTSLPHERHDQPVDIVVTDREIVRSEASGE
jgi:5-formyltetrahydrofolate cyclo-ligase